MIGDTSVLISKFAEKQLKKVPSFIKEALFVWARAVEESGLREVRKLPGYHDEPLKGQRAGQRSIKLNRGYRAIYEEDKGGNLILITVLEVNKHEY